MSSAKIFLTIKINYLTQLRHVRRSVLARAGKKTRTPLERIKSSLMGMGVGGENRKKMGMGRVLLK